MLKCITFVCILILSVFTSAQNNSPLIIEAFTNLPDFIKPVDIQNAGDGSNRLFVVEQEGIIKVFEAVPGVNSYSTFLNISDSIISGGEKGLLGLAFHPEYENNGFFYVNYTIADPLLRTVISRFSVSSSNSNDADENSELVLLTFDQPGESHNGGQLAFGPDSNLYIASGDGGEDTGSPNNPAKNTSSMLGKILRINVTENGYSIPLSNPFSNEVYAYGFRNPWRMSFDSTELWCADVGQDAKEEINIITSGGNYGWNCYEGTDSFVVNNCAGSEIDPVFEYDNVGGASVTGGYVYNGQIPSLKGKYIFADFMNKEIWSLERNGSEITLVQKLNNTEAQITSFGVDESNELYFVGFSPGKIYKFEPEEEEGLPVELISFTGVKVNDNVILNWTTVTEVDNYGFEVERMSDAETKGWMKIGFVDGYGNSNSPKNYTFNDDKLVNSDKLYYRLKQIDTDGTTEYSSPVEVSVHPNNFELSQNFPNPFNPTTIISYSVPEKSTIKLKVYNLLGKEVRTLFEGEQNAGFYLIEWDGTNYNNLKLPSGVYFYRIESGNFTETKKMTLMQ